MQYIGAYILLLGLYGMIPPIIVTVFNFIYWGGIYFRCRKPLFISFTVTALLCVIGYVFIRLSGATVMDALKEV